MIAIAHEKHAADSIPALVFRTATAERLRLSRTVQRGSGIQLSPMVRDLPGTLRRIHALLAAEGLFISKTPCLGDMNPLIRFALPAMRAISKAPYVGVFRAADLSRHICAAGFDILATENHAAKGNDKRPYIARGDGRGCVEIRPAFRRESECCSHV